MPLSPEQQKHFEALFEKPSIAAMYALQPKAFEKFVLYVFERAGYEVRDVAFHFLRGVDLELCQKNASSRRVGGIEVKRFAPQAPVGAAIIQKLIGAPAIRGNGQSGYVVTTSHFTQDAHNMAQTDKRIHLISGETLLRYITYLKGSTYQASVDSKTPTARFIPPDVLADVEAMKHRKASTTRVLTIANNKGGVGKTTTARFVAYVLAQKGLRVLLVDMDAQANLSEYFLETQAATITKPHFAGYLAGEYPLTQAVRQTTYDGMWLLPAHPDLQFLDTGGAGNPEKEVRFVADVYDSFGSPELRPYAAFDWIILDTPPAISAYTRYALAAADYVLAPARARPSSRAGLLNTLNSLTAMGALMDRQPVLLGCVLTQWTDDLQSRDTVKTINELCQQFNSRIFEQKIPMDATIERTTMKPTSRAYAAYAALVEEMMSYVSSS